jgi:hypothetical protein
MHVPRFGLRAGRLVSKGMILMPCKLSRMISVSLTRVLLVCTPPGPRTSCPLHT